MDHRPVTRDSLILIDFLRFTARKDISWEEMFTLNTLKEFPQFSGFKHASRPLTALSGFLYSNGKIPKPLTTPRRLIDLLDSTVHFAGRHIDKTSRNFGQQSLEP